MLLNWPTLSNFLIIKLKCYQSIAVDRWGHRIATDLPHEATHHGKFQFENFNLNTTDTLKCGTRKQHTGCHLPALPNRWPDDPHRCVIHFRAP